MAKTNPEAPMIKQGKWKYTWHMMKTNKACYAMLLPFMSLFIIFTVVPCRNVAANGLYKL